jgi:RNA-directed DNA polymerase
MIEELPNDESKPDDFELHDLDLESTLEFKYSSLLNKSCEELKEHFFQLQISRDVAKILEIPYRSLVYHIYKVRSLLRYKSFEIPKKSGDNRIIVAPNTALKLIQRKLSQVLYCVYETKPSVHGFAPGKSIVTNAKIHAKKRHVLNIDLKDFFSSINFGRVRGMFMGKHYNLNSNVATVLAQICCHENRLPQGAPSSPIVSNMICARMDSQFQQLAKEYKCNYTRYVDDITFSTTLPKFPEALAYRVLENDGNKTVLGQAILLIIMENGFKLNEKKVRLQVKNSHQEVTGLTVNKFPNVDRCYVRNIRAMLHSWAKFGLESADIEHRKKYNTKCRLPKKDVPSLKQVLRGKIEYLGVVRGKDDPIYLKFLHQYRELAKSEKS